MRHIFVVLLILTGCLNLFGQSNVGSPPCEKELLTDQTCLHAPSTPFTKEKYLHQRACLVAKAEKKSFAAKVTLSEDEERVNGYLQSLLANEVSASPFLPTLNFIPCQKQIESSPLYHFLQRMPKGAVLHAHALALGDLRWIVNTVTYRADCYMYMGEKQGHLLPGAVRLFETPPEGPWESVAHVRQKAEDTEAFDQRLYESFVMTSKDSSLPNVWEKFQNCFYYYFGVLADTNVYKAFLKNALLQLIQEDTVQSIELRDAPKEQLILMYKELSEEIQKQYPYFSLKVICDGSRSKDRSQVLEAAKETLRLRKQYPEIVAGFGLSGEEDKGHPILYYLNDLLEMNRLAQRENISLPYCFHAGETDWPFSNSPEDSHLIFNNELYDVLLLNSKRVGHALSLVKNPFLMKQFKRAQIAIETCPISNQILGYVKDLRNHPAVTYLNAGLAVTLNPDDPAIFGYKGVTADFWEACVAWELDLRALKQLALNSIRHSSLDSDQKATLLKTWEQKWDTFIAETVQNQRLQ